MILAQLTDTHVLNPESTEERWVDNNGRLEAAVASLNGEVVPPTAILATGDLTNNHQPGELDELQRLLAPLHPPILALPGNHDDRAELRVAFDMPWADDDNLSWCVEVQGLQIVGLDTTVPERQHGEFDTHREEWLRDALADTAGQPTVLAMHHPPFVSGIEWMDETMLKRAEVFADVIEANRHVLRIFCGHLHRPVQTAIRGVPTSVGLSTVHHVALNTTESAPIEIIRDPPGYQLHHFDGANWVSHTRYIDTGELAFTPSWAIADG
ncbi:MAG: phosphodiesterase [Acidimicrobiia bacterium]|nr:phosphodiesterase [Acidimicrobiia bacterium]